MSDGDELYFVSRDGKKSGPFKPQQIRNKLNQGKLSKSDFIWRDGMPDWQPISSIIDELPGHEPPPAPPPLVPSTLTITHPNGVPPTTVDIPPKGIYEPPATLKQKNLLMKIGSLENPEMLRNLGRDQASFLIDAFKKDYDALQRRATAGKGCSTAIGLAAVMILALIAWLLALPR